MSSILVTGGTGYLGQGIVKQLVADRNKVIVCGTAGSHVAGADYYECDIFSIDDPYAYFKKPDCVLHLAWKDGFNHNSEAHLGYLNDHCKLVKKLLDGGLKHLAVMGSVHEIGFHEGSVDASTPCNPMNNYGIAKNALRQYCEVEACAHSAKLQWLRGYYIVGNPERGCSVFSKIYAAAREGKKTFPFVTGENQFDFLDYGEFCYKTASVVEQDQLLGIINICSGRPQRLRDRVERFIKEEGLDIALEYGAFQERPYDSVAIWGNSRDADELVQRRGA